MSTIEKEKKVNLDAGLDPNYTELDPDFTDDMDYYELTEFCNSTLIRLIGYCGRQEFIEEQKENLDQDRLKKLDALSLEFSTARKTTDYDNEEDMRNLLKKYMPMLRRVCFGGQLA